jgi:hypothetical protein
MTPFTVNVRTPDGRIATRVLSAETQHHAEDMAAGLGFDVVWSAQAPVTPEPAQTEGTDAPEPAQTEPAAAKPKRAKKA